MRVIAGSARSLKLKTLPGDNTRPTTDRIKETLFNMLAPQLTDAAFLDLCAGSGGIGIEALSRGAATCVFVEKNRTAARIIKENLAHTHLNERARVLERDAVSALGQLADAAPFDVIFMDPPYQLGLEREVLPVLAASALLGPDSLIIVEADRHTDFSFLPDCGLRLVKNKLYKTNKHVFIERA